MRLFGTFKFIEAYLLIVGILMLYSFQKLCAPQESNPKDITAFLKSSRSMGVSENQYGDSSLTDQKTDFGTDAPLMNGSHVEPVKDADATENNLTLPTFEVMNVSTTSMPPAVIVNTTFTLNATITPVITEIYEDEVPETTQGTVEMVIKADELPTSRVGGKILPTDPPTVEDDKILTAIPDGRFLPISTDVASSTIKHAALTSEEPKSGKDVFGFFTRIFSSNKADAARRRRNANFTVAENTTQEPDAVSPFVASKYPLLMYPIVKGQSEVGVYRCEHETSYAFKNFWSEQNVYQSLFTARYVHMALLFIHFVLTCYHAIVNTTHRIPTSQRFNRVFASIGLSIWGIVSLWILYHYIMWNSKFSGIAFTPLFPDELKAFLILALAMSFLLIYELITPMMIFKSYDVSVRRPRSGYVPAAQSENEYIDGIITRLETSHPVNDAGVLQA